MHEGHREAGPKDGDHTGHHTNMAADFRKWFWISLVITLPIVVLSPMLQVLVGLREAIRFPSDLYVLFTAMLLPRVEAETRLGKLQGCIYGAHRLVPCRDGAPVTLGRMCRRLR